QLPLIGEIISLARILTLILALAILLTRFTRFELIIMIFFLTIIFSSIVNQNLLLGTLYRLVILFGLIVFLLNQFKYNFKEIITALYYLLSSLIILNFLTVLIGGLGYTSSGHIEYLLGRKNHLIFTIIPFITIVYIYSYKMYSKVPLRNLLLMLIGLVSVILAGSGTGIILAIILLLFIIQPKIFKFSMRFYIIVYVVLFFSNVIYRLQEKWFSFIIVDILEKDTNLSGRTLLWDISLEAIQKKLIIGYGRGNTVINDVYSYLSETHNGILQLLLDSGILGLFMFTIIIIIVSIRLNTFSENNFSKVISLSLFLFLINSLSESIFLIREFWLIIVFGFVIEKIIKEDLQVSKSINRNEYKKI